MKTESTDQSQQELGEDRPDSTEFFKVEDFNARLDAALDGSDFDTSNPEITQSIESFYADHYALAEIVDSALEGSLDTQTADFLIDSFNHMKQGDSGERDLSANYIIAASVKNLAESVRDDLQEKTDDTDTDNLVMSGNTLGAAIQCFGMLFMEDSIGITTVDEAELEVLADLHSKLTDKITEVSEENGSRVQVVEGKISSKVWYLNEKGQQSSAELSNIERIRDEIGYGQQSFWQDVRYAGQLEFHNSGFLGKIYAAGGVMPRTEQVRRGLGMSAQNGAEKTEMHSNVPHFSEMYDPFSYKQGDTLNDGATNPGTIAFPLSSIISVAPYARDSEYAVVEYHSSTDHVHVNRGTHQIGVGNFDQAGMSGQDRVFFASPRQNDPDNMPDNFAIPIGVGGKESEAIVIFNDDGEEKRAAKRIGNGESYPKVVKVEEDGFEADMNQLQDESIDKHGSNNLVVPLRRGVFRFAAEGMHPYAMAERERATFNVNPVLALAS